MGDLIDKSAWAVANLRDLGDALRNIPYHDDPVAMRAVFWDMARELARYQELLLGILYAQEVAEKKEASDGGDGDGGDV